MARWSAARCRSGGGEGIQAPRPGHARLATALAALGAGAGLGAYPALADPRFAWLTLGLGAAGLALLAAGLATGWGPFVGWSLATFGAQYALLISTGGRSFDEATPIYAAAFFLVGELAFWSVQRRVSAWTEPWLLLRRLAYVAGACAGAAVVAGAVLVAAAASRGGGVALEAVGVVAAVGALALMTLLVRRLG